MTKVYTEIDGEMVQLNTRTLSPEDGPHVWDENGKCATPWCGCED